MLRALPLALLAFSAPALGETSARLGQAVRVDGPTVRPIAVIEDSRCPAGTRCIWAGRVVVRVAVRGGNWRRTLDLTLGGPAVPIADGALSLTGVVPTRGTKPIPRRAYRFTFAFAGGL